MPRAHSDARTRLVATAADLLRRRGLNATSIRDLAKLSNAPLGSTYHYFPGGKQQLINEAVVFAGNQIQQGLHAALEAGPQEGVQAFLLHWRQILIKTDYRAGCPVIAVAIEEPNLETAAALETTAKVFATWEGILAESLNAHGACLKDATEIATLIVCAVEGALLLCRAKRSTAPLDLVAAQLEHIIRAALP